MGVMTCYRAGCYNIMCGNYSSKYGYLCDECKTELKSKIGVGFNKFMRTPVQKNVDTYSPEEWEQKVDKEFTSRFEGESF